MAHDTDRKGGATVTADSIPAGNGSATADGAPAKGGGPVTGHPVLQVDRLRVTVHHKEILRGVDLTLHEGEWLGVIGPNGAGKSTLLGAMAGVRRFTGGLTLASGRPPRARDISLMPQTPLLPPGMTVAEYILMGRTAHLRWLAQESQKDRDIVAQVIRRLSLADFADRIVTYLADGDLMHAVVEHFGDYVREETLSVDLVQVHGGASGAGASGDGASGLPAHLPSATFELGETTVTVAIGKK